ncbi:MAG: energy-coupling factor transporter transmembrane protein EcfT [Deltaproteobacteria bacterium]|nr:energy-coupling factor transporter transmembrane protein EcfT [Deltaproteobacteria bacterium]
MARIALHYFPGNSPLHRWDGRCKFFGLLMITATLIQTNISLFIFDSILLVALFFLSRFPIKQLLRELRFWAIFLFILFLFQALLAPGTRLHSFHWLPVSKEGLLLGGLTCWRLGLIFGYTVLFTAVTRPRELRDALIWILKPIPFLPERRIGLMVTLTLRFFSRTLDWVEEVSLAHQARLGDQNKNPFRKAKLLALPVLRRSLLEVEEVTFALAARGYRDDLSIHLSKISLFHLIPLFILLGLFMMIFIFF